MESQVRRGWHKVLTTAGEHHLSREVYVHSADGQMQKHTLSVVYVLPGGRMHIEPFEGETAATLYHDSPIHIIYKGEEAELYEGIAP